MRVFNAQVHDDTISGETPVYTRPDFNDKLGSVDRLGICYVVDQVNADGTIAFTIEHSADGLNWLVRGDAQSETAKANEVRVYYGTDSEPEPRLAFVRIKMVLATTAQAHVRIWVTGRDDS